MNELSVKEQNFSLYLFSDLYSYWSFLNTETRKVEIRKIEPLISLTRQGPKLFIFSLIQIQKK